MNLENDLETTVKHIIEKLNYGYKENSEARSQRLVYLNYHCVMN